MTAPYREFFARSEGFSILGDTTVHYRRRLLPGIAAVMGIAALLLMGSDLVVAKKPSKSPDKKKAPEELPVTTFMKAKLTASKSVLEGLVTEDFKKIERGAEKMLVMSNSAEWKVIQGPVYAQYSAEFRRSVKKLIKEAKEKDIDGAGLSYMHITMNCISCHRYLKGTRIVRAEDVSHGHDQAL